MDPQLVNGLLAGVGQAAGAVAVAALFLGFTFKVLIRVEAAFISLYQQLEELAKDKGTIIRANTDAMNANTQATRRLEDAVNERIRLDHGDGHR